MENQQIQPAGSSNTDSFDNWIESIRHLSKSIASKMNNSLRQIDDINMRVRLLSFNAQIQAAKAGDAGRTFAVVANEIGNLSTNTARVAEGLAQETKQDITQLSDISSRLDSVVRGARLRVAGDAGVDAAAAAAVVLRSVLRSVSITSSTFPQLTQTFFNFHWLMPFVVTSLCSHSVAGGWATGTALLAFALAFASVRRLLWFS